MNGLPTLKAAPGLFPGIDMPLGQAIVTINSMQGLDREITALKIGSQPIEECGFLTTTKLLEDIGNTLPLCFDRQKGATDVPFMVRRQVGLASRYKIASYIGSPLGAGSNNVEGKEGTLQSFVASCREHQITPIVVLEMTQPGSLHFSSQMQAEALAKAAYDLGVRYFVAPATRPDRIAAYRAIIGSSEIISPGVGPQKSGDPLKDAQAAIMHGADHIVVGRAIYNAPDPVVATKELYAAISSAYFWRFVVDNDVVGFFDEAIKLKSGRMSHWYVNWRTTTSDVYLTNKLVDFLLDFLSFKQIEFDTIYGVPEGATKLAVLAQNKWALRQQGLERGSHVLAMGRSKAKEHGAKKDKLFLGEPRGRVVVIEDVTTTGGSLLDTIEALQSTGKEVVAAVGLTNRLARRDDGKSVADAVKVLGVPYHSMSTAADLLPHVARKLNPSDDVRVFINREFAEHGVEKIEI